MGFMMFDRGDVGAPVICDVFEGAPVTGEGAAGAPVMGEGAAEGARSAADCCAACSCNDPGTGVGAVGGAATIGAFEVGSGVRGARISRSLSRAVFQLFHHGHGHAGAVLAGLIDRGAGDDAEPDACRADGQRVIVCDQG